MASAKKGNYIVFFPSYQYMNRVREVKKRFGKTGKSMEVLIQDSHMTEEEREAFLQKFSPERTAERDTSLVAFCVMGGLFSEGIDLTGDRLIGVIVVGTGLPMVCTEQKILQGYFEEAGKDGFAYAYQYPGMNKVLQAAGRVIRTASDQGVILLLDDRFWRREYPGNYFQGNGAMSNGSVFRLWSRSFRHFGAVFQKFNKFTRCL